jgi:hypothetical protein
MLKKTITYSDLDGNPVVEDFYFNLSKAEIAEMELSKRGGLSAYLQELVDAQDGGQIISAFKEILTKSLGRRSEDGKRFVKNQQIIDDFLQSDAYSVLFMELISGDNAGADFVAAIVPQDMAKELTKVENVELPQEEPAWIKEDREPTQEEMAKMDRDQLLEVFKRRQYRNK